MKKYLYLAAALFVAAACSREPLTPEEHETQLEKGPIPVKLIAGKPETRTELGYDGDVLKPYWSVGDRLGVTKVPVNSKDTPNDIFNSTLSSRSLTGAFEGKLYAGNNYYAYYPYIDNLATGVESAMGFLNDGSNFVFPYYSEGQSSAFVYFTVPSIQHPTPTSFDKSADLLISKPFTVAETSEGNVDIMQEVNLEFTRVNAILKVVLVDMTKNTFLNEENVLSISLENEEAQVIIDYAPETRANIEGMNNEVPGFTGRVAYMLPPESGFCFSDYDRYTIKNTVTAVYNEDNGFYKIGADNQAAYFIMFPVTVKQGFSGDGLKLTVETEHFKICRTIPIPVDGFAIQPSRVTTLNIGLYDMDDSNHGQEMIIRRRGGIEFADPVMEEICLNLFDANNDLCLTEAEVAAVRALGADFVQAVNEKNDEITSFDEFRYFTGITTIPERAFQYCKYMTSIQIPENVKTIGIEAFDNCRSLSEINLPYGLTNIGAHAFYFCLDLYQVTIPETVTTIGGGAFYNCRKLSTVYMERTTPPALGKDFGYNSQSVRVYLDDNLVFYNNNGQILSNLYIWVKNNDARVAYVSDSEWNEYSERIVVDK